MGMKMYFKIQKIDQILPDFWKLFEKLDKIVYYGTIFFRIFFQKMAESSAKNVGGRNLGRTSVSGNFGRISG